MENKKRIEASDIKAGDMVLFEFSHGVGSRKAVRLRRVSRVTQTLIIIDHYRFKKTQDSRYGYIGWLQEGDKYSYRRTHKIYGVDNPEMAEQHKNFCLDTIIDKYIEKLTELISEIGDYNTLEKIGKILTKEDSNIESN